MKIATWNVNGIRARKDEVASFLERERPDVLCLQELKATLPQIPETLADLNQYWGYWHGSKGYSGVSLHVHKEHCADQPKFWHPEFDHETRIVVADMGALSVASIYVPNGGKNYQAKLAFLRALEDYVAAIRNVGRPMVICGDLNVARTENDVHPKLRDERVVGQRPEERMLIESILEKGGLRDVGRDLDPQNFDLFTWWAPWRNMRQRNMGWRLDYVLATADLAAHAKRSTVVREPGTSDHGPVIIEFELRQA
jgi:exodeoxyribonuclease III